MAAVGTDRPTAGAIDRARAAGVSTFVAPVGADRESWENELAERVGSFAPDLVVSAGFMRLAGPAFLARFAGRYVNSHPALLPAFPGMHGVRDAISHGVKVAGATLFVVDDGVDTGPIIAQVAVEVLDDDDESALHERIKAAERGMLVDMVGRMLRDGFRVSGRKVTVP